MRRSRVLGGGGGGMFEEFFGGGGGFGGGFGGGGFGGGGGGGRRPKPPQDLYPKGSKVSKLSEAKFPKKGSAHVWLVSLRELLWTPFVWCNVRGVSSRS